MARDDPPGEFLELTLALALLYDAAERVVSFAVMRADIAVVRTSSIVGLIDAMAQVENMGLGPDKEDA